MRAKKAYTLIELLLVLAILSIISLLAIPDSEILLRMRERQEIEELRKDLLFVRNRAIVEAENYEVLFSREENKYYIKHRKSGLTIKTKEFKHGIKISINNMDASFQFNRNGNTGKGGTIYLRDRKNNRYHLTLTPATGRMELKEVGK